MIQIFWQRNPDNTKITLIAGDNEPSILQGHKLQVDIGYDKTELTSTWEKGILYECNTDQCNSISQLKRLLSSLMITDNLYQLTYLLNPVLPFQGEWCYRGSNVTFEECDTTIPTSSCKQCILSGMINQTRTELCATCSSKDPDKGVLSHQMLFNMIDRTKTTFWLIMCGREDCNTPAVGDSIRQKSDISFDFDKFFHTDNKSTSILSMNKMTLLCVDFRIKVCDYFKFSRIITTT
ncbi:unnamed protein product [Rotaria sp. Silwood1]|nr:unnamed protein product [Rotaria sp. Silwood1]CAF3510844.1 unnamed protein product [Rotaria sp. Silwood1]CAF3571499.1 unnamed protein product [Rotaria sp. Silwood1]CAF4838958.1 unnamed protein product [Rotaria sp. Silwood1]CAF4861061.1 unnamed protein product [Rotaria sp. Silwood1]